MTKDYVINVSYDTLSNLYDYCLKHHVPQDCKEMKQTSRTLDMMSCWITKE